MDKTQEMHTDFAYPHCTSVQYHENSCTDFSPFII